VLLYFQIPSPHFIALTLAVFHSIVSENSYRKQITLDEESLMLDILDTAGQEEYSVCLQSHAYTITPTSSLQKFLINF
jgi:GTPase SAR1 family protein